MVLTPEIKLENLVKLAHKLLTLRLSQTQLSDKLKVLEILLNDFLAGQRFLVNTRNKGA